MDSPGGIVNVYKPENVTSFSVVMDMRRIFRTRKVGHIGTLDPFAKGVLPVCIGRATGAARYMEDYDKRYRVVMSFGERTDTQDRTGSVIARNYPSSSDLKKIADSDYEDLRKILSEIQGESMQMTPMYSARKVNGVPLYKMARKGIDIPRESKKINIFSARLVNANTDDGVFTAVVDIHCSKGTYIRTICDDIGHKLTYFAHARELTRLASGPFSAGNSVNLDEISGIEDPYTAFGRITGFFNTDFALTDMPRRSLTDDESARIIQGQTLSFSDMNGEEKYSIYSETGKWLGVVRLVDKEGLGYRAERIFADAGR